MPFASCLLHIAYCILHIAYCLLHIAYLPIAYCLLPLASWLREAFLSFASQFFFTTKTHEEKKQHKENTKE